jgi:multimeric flavodoxin WrbA
MKTVLVDFSLDHSYADRMRRDLVGMGVACVLFQIEDVKGCTGCGKCWKKRRCVMEDEVNQVIDLMETADGLVLICPVYYGRADERIMKFVTRLYHSGSDRLNHKLVTCLFETRGKDCQGAFFEVMDDFVRSRSCLLVPAECGRIRTYEKRKTETYAFLLHKHEQAVQDGVLNGDPVIVPFSEFVR